MAAIRAEAIRLLPQVKIGSAWTDTALVNAQVIFWADTDRDRTLAAANLLGTTIALRISFAHADWDFDDGRTDSTSDPGKAYDKAGDPCDTPQCPDYYGHTYRQTGRRNVALTVTWHAQYSIAGGPFTDLDPDITGPTSHHALVVKQARGILVPNPGD